MINMTSKATHGHPSTGNYMDEAQRAHFKLVLSNWKLQLMEDDAGHAQTVTGGSLNGYVREIIADPLDQATQIADLQIELLTLGRLRKLIAKIDSSIDLIDHDDYGYCATCGVEIGILRLQARPTAIQCIDCKSLEELKERQTGGRISLVN